MAKRCAAPPEDYWIFKDQSIPLSFYPTIRSFSIMHGRLLALTFLAFSTALATARQIHSDLFIGTGKSPHHTYRIPSLCVTKSGALLAFAELRKNGASDSGDIDTVVKRSTDGGRTWSEERIVLDIDEHTIGNACPVVDPESGRITVIAVWNKVHESHTAPGFGSDSRLVYRTYSDDDGLTWSDPENISQSVKRASWSWIATGPGSGIVLTRGKHKGRFVIGINHKETAGEQPAYHAHVIYSDDRGETWKSSSGRAAAHTNECEVAELENGDLMLNMRNHGSARRERAVTISKDGGETWEKTVWDETLPEPQCMASLKRHSWTSGSRPGVLLFCNPASRRGRENLTLRASIDDGKSWSRQIPIKAGDAAYSHLAVLPDGTIAIAYETDGYKKIRFTTRCLNDLEPAAR